MDWTGSEGNNYEDLSELYGEFLGVWYRYMDHVVTNVGGVYHTLKTSEQEGVVFEPVPANIQRNAIRFLNTIQGICTSLLMSLS